MQPQGKSFRESFLRIIISSLFGGVFYFFWMGIYLISLPKDRIFEGILWIAAPMITGIGFALGISLYDRLAKHERVSFFRVLVWPLVGCVLGALIIYWSGPMLIVFTMLSPGIVSIILREIIYFGGGNLFK